MNVVILCGGRGVIDPETRQRIPKALMQVGGRPLIWHVMKIFAAAGHEDFVLALGEGGDAIRRHFLHQHLEGRDLLLHSGSSKVEYLSRSNEENWRIKCIDTGLNAQTGSRIARCRRHLEGQRFFLTYSDCLCSVDLAALAQAHERSGKLLTVTGVQPTTRFGTFSVNGGQVVGYNLESKLTGIGGYLNGGFMVMEPGIFDHLELVNECTLEREVFAKLVALQQAAVFPHDGYWQAVDTERDLQTVSRLYTENQRPWLSLNGGQSTPPVAR
jgi:glucose-1-phosphate cytidylyltransferase